MPAIEKLICIVEDKPELRDAMSMMVSTTPGFLLGGSYANAEEALKEIAEMLPDAVLMDISLPGMSGIHCVATLKNIYPKILFLMCTAYDDGNKIFDSLKAGASGYILKSEGTAKIMDALKEMFAGGSPMSSGIARKVVSSFKEMETENIFVQTLTTKEKLVLENLAKGLMNKEVADILSISLATVRTHIQNIYNKLHVNTRVEAVNLFFKR